MSESKVENYIYKEGENRPWYFSSTAMYDAVKGAISAIKMNPAMFDKTTDLLNKMTTFVKEKTGAGVVIVTRENATELLEKLDGFLRDQLIVVDDGLDHLRRKLADALRGLIDGLQLQKEMAALKISQLPKRAGDAKEASVRVVKSNFEYMLGLCVLALDTFKNNCPQTYEKVAAITTNTYQKAEDSIHSMANRGQDAINKVDEQIVTASAHILKTAQPYVHGAVERGTPLLVTAVEVSQPYVVQARPYLEPFVHRVLKVRSALEEHKVVGPYVVRAYETANKTMEDVKEYCFAGEEQAAAEVSAKLEALFLAAAPGVELVAPAQQPSSSSPAPVQAESVDSAATPIEDQGQGAPVPAPEPKNSHRAKAKRAGPAAGAGPGAGAAAEAGPVAGVVN